MKLINKAKNALNDAESLEKYFLISASVNSSNWRVDFSENLQYREILTAFVFCMSRFLYNLEEKKKNKLLSKFFGFFPQDKQMSDSHLDKLNNPEQMIRENDFALFIVDFNEGSCDLKSNCEPGVLIQVIYWAFQVVFREVKKNPIDDFVSIMKKFGLLGDSGNLEDNIMENKS